mmetsp:Transcript_12615/g.44166  ORF Transcript_12615/g.44166 Transcript_12615/m.44166 type:complete len:243 (-) Transcript_12615:691-1419(-)
MMDRTSGMSGPWNSTRRKRCARLLLLDATTHAMVRADASCGFETVARACFGDAFESTSLASRAKTRSMRERAASVAGPSSKPHKRGRDADDDLFDEGEDDGGGRDGARRFAHHKVLSALAAEAAWRKSAAGIAAMSAAEQRGDTDWMDVVAAKQKQLAAEYGVGVDALRAAGRDSTDPAVFWSRANANRVSESRVEVGDRAWALTERVTSIAAADGEPCTMEAAIRGMPTDKRRLLIFGSVS